MGSRLGLGAADRPCPAARAELQTIFPAGGKQGTTVEVTLTGANLEEAAALVFSHPGITGQASAAAGEGQSRRSRRPADSTCKIAGDVPTGVYEARFVGRWGVSNPRAFVVGHLAETVKNEASKTRATAQPIGVDVTVNGRADAAARDYYRLTLKQGQRVLIECLAQRIDSRLDGTLVVLNAAGRELAYNRDSVGRDPLIDFTAPGGRRIHHRGLRFPVPRRCGVLLSSVRPRRRLHRLCVPSVRPAGYELRLGGLRTESSRRQTGERERGRHTAADLPGERPAAGR